MLVQPTDSEWAWCSQGVANDERSNVCSTHTRTHTHAHPKGPTVGLSRPCGSHSSCLTKAAHGKESSTPRQQRSDVAREQRPATNPARRSRETRRSQHSPRTASNHPPQHKGRPDDSGRSPEQIRRVGVCATQCGDQRQPEQQAHAPQLSPRQTMRVHVKHPPIDAANHARRDATQRTHTAALKAECPAILAMMAMAPKANARSTTAFQSSPNKAAIPNVCCAAAKKHMGVNTFVAWRRLPRQRRSGVATAATRALSDAPSWRRREDDEALSIEWMVLVHHVCTARRSEWLIDESPGQGQDTTTAADQRRHGPRH